MINLRIKFSATKWKSVSDDRRRALEGLPEEAYRYFVAQTPIRSGNARRKTRLIGRTIRADYPYAGKLDQEAWSKQAPRGMTIPTLEWLRARVRAILRR